jgi:F-type H+-transporting ATPase subunit epsilon
MKKINLTIVSPEKPIVEKKQVDSVVFPSFEGEMGVLPGHIKGVFQLQPGILHYIVNGVRSDFAVLGGFAEVFKDDVLVFAEEAALGEEINFEEERQRAAKAKMSLSSRDADIDLELAEIELKAALMKMKLKNRSSGKMQ